MTLEGHKLKSKQTAVIVQKSKQRADNHNLNLKYQQTAHIYNLKCKQTEFLTTLISREKFVKMQRIFNNFDLTRKLNIFS